MTKPKTTRKAFSKNPKKIENDLSIYNLDGVEEKNKYRNKNKFIPQHPFRWIISGGSGTGKTNMVLNFIYRFADFDKLFIYTKHPNQPKFAQLMQLFEDGGRSDDIIVGTNSEDVPAPEELDCDNQNLILFDDMLLEKDQTPIIEMFIRGRHSNASVIYLTQSYFKVSRNIRLQCSYFSFYECNRREMNTLYQELGNDLSKKTFFNRIAQATTRDYSFLFVDKKTRNKSMRYRKNFDELFDEDEEEDVSIF